MAFVERDILIESFQDGDFPNGNDFKNLIDSCYNYSLSDLPDVFSFVQAASSEWKDAYTFVSSNSSQIAYKEEVDNTFVNLTGGIISGSLLVTENITAYQQILSADRDLHDIFLTSETDNQKLSFNKTNTQLDIDRGNNVSLSALKTIIEVPFTHSLFNPIPGVTYIFGQFPQLIPINGAIPQSLSYLSQHKGIITKVTAINSYIDGSAETHTLSIVNRTRNLSAIIADNIRYTTNALVSDPTPIQGGTATLKSGLPGTWSGSNITPITVPEEEAGIILTQNASFIETPSFNATLYTALSVQLAHLQASSSGVPGSVEVLYSLDDGQNFINNNYRTGVNNNQINFATDSIVIVPSQPFTENVKLRFTKVESSTRKIKDIVTIGRFVSTNTRNITKNLTPALQVQEGDIIDVRLSTNSSSYINPPTNVVNLVNATLYVEG